MAEYAHVLEQRLPLSVNVGKDTQETTVKFRIIHAAPNRVKMEELVCQRNMENHSRTSVCVLQNFSATTAKVLVVPLRQRNGVRWFMVNSRILGCGRESSSILGFGRESRFVVRFFWFTAVSWDLEENQGSYTKSQYGSYEGCRRPILPLHGDIEYGKRDCGPSPFE
uniref:Uncharacterized protein LOC111113565 n=1 Tax=Crassostrea virginica TaxID=6565 RepID=A0A8B8BXI6_CRAVI|nr:uncharacterized protein LOC111113565 [Crassostrea virginica]